MHGGTRKAGGWKRDKIDYLTHHKADKILSNLQVAQGEKANIECKEFLPLNKERGSSDVL